MPTQRLICYLDLETICLIYFDKFQLLSHHYEALAPLPVGWLNKECFLNESPKTVYSPRP